MSTSLLTYIDVPGFFFFFNDTATTEIYTLSLHDALPISQLQALRGGDLGTEDEELERLRAADQPRQRSEEHTSELQSPCNLVCRLLLEKKKKMYSLYMLTTNPTRSRS